MPTFRVKIDTAAFRRAGVTKAKEMRAALDDAVLYLAASARKRLAEATVRYFDRPTRFTENAFRYRLLKGEAPAALVYVLPLQARYLGLQVFGGDRVTGDYGTVSRGVLLPGRDAVLDAYGNLPRDTVEETLSAGGRWIPEREGRPEALVLPGRDKLRIIAEVRPRVTYEARFPFHDIVEEVVRERGGGALDHVLRRGTGA